MTRLLLVASLFAALFVAGCGNDDVDDGGGSPTNTVLTDTGTFTGDDAMTGVETGDDDTGTGDNDDGEDDSGEDDGNTGTVPDG
jgi:hypothetical protein